MHNNAKLIEHKGVIRSISNAGIVVELENTSACGSCYAQGVCGVSDGGIRSVTVPLCREPYEIGETVRVLIAASRGRKAIILSYVVPFCVLFLTLIIAMRVVRSEIIAGTIAVALLAPYYICLYLCRDYFEKTFTLTIRK